MKKQEKRIFPALLSLALALALLPVMQTGANAVSVSTGAVQSLVSTAQSVTGKDLAYFRDNYGMPYYDWCGYFVAWCINNSEISASLGSISYGTAGGATGAAIWAAQKDAGTIYVLATGANVRAHKDVYYTHLINGQKYDGTYVAGKAVPSSNVQKVDSFSPQAGDIVLFNWDNDGAFDHVGIMTSATTYIDGNGGASINTSVVTDGRSLPANYVVGYFRFNTGAAPVVPGKPSFSVNVTEGANPNTRFSWNKVQNADWYDVLIYQNGVLLDKLWNNTGTSVTYQLSPGSYQAAVAAVNQSSEKWTNSDIVSFTVKSVAQTCTVRFDANGGSVSPSSMTVTVGSPYGALPTPTRSGYRFLGWGASKDASVYYTSSSTVANPASHTLYAVWQKTPSTGSAQIAAASQSAAAGGRVTVPIKIQNNPGVTAFNFNISYDGSKLDLIDMSKGSGFSEATVNTAANPIQVIWVSSSQKNVTGAGTVLELVFRVKANASGETQIKITPREAESAAGTVNLTAAAGTITIGSTVGGLLGDVNGDGTISLRDVTTLRKYLVGMSISINAANADVNGDGTVSLRDVTTLQKYLVGLISSLN